MAVDAAVVFQPRSYQLEMLEASMRENIIVAMDTGSGKTHIAILRIIAELERCPPGKLIWFLAPTVDLCIQQHKAVSSSIPGVRSRTLTGSDNVDLWTDQATWDAVLDDMQVIVSTHAILADALGHGLVKISRLALLVFDEAHHCKKSHPANKIMRDFYHPALLAHGPSAVPYILGLSASPIVKSRAQELELIESNLNAVCRTPREYRAELLQHTNCPKIVPLKFSPRQEMLNVGQVSMGLQFLMNKYDYLSAYDYINNSQATGSLLADGKLRAVASRYQEYSELQLKKFTMRCAHIVEELGLSAADYFIRTSIEQFRESVSDPSIARDWDDDGKIYLLKLLSDIPLADITLDSSFTVSSKLIVLIDFLAKVYSTGFSGLIFVKQRVIAVVLAYILSIHPRTKDRYRCASYVGWSNNSNRRDYLGDILDTRLQRNTLEDFRNGKKNLIISTDVLEEGIDVSACSVVVCYDPPANLKSFVQRRGRARQKVSIYAILFREGDELASLHKWRELEDAMIKAYQDDQRQQGEELADREDEDEEMTDVLMVESTGARLLPSDAMAHLHHFCAVLPSEPYVDNRPVFSIEEDEVGCRRRTIILPNSVHPKVRVIKGIRKWRTKKAAMRDVAFQAYKSLYEFGLVNNNLLPLTSKPELRSSEAPPHLPSLVQASVQYDPWADLADSWATPFMHKQRISIRRNGDQKSEVSMALMVPAFLPTLAPLTLYWDKGTTFTLTFGPATPAHLERPDSVQNMKEATAIFLEAIGSKFPDAAKDFVVLFGPDIPEHELGNWINANKGDQSAQDVYSSRKDVHSSEMGIVRNYMEYNNPLIFRRWIVTEGDGPTPVINVECQPLPRRRNLLSRQTLAEIMDIDQEDADGTSDVAAETRVYPAVTCTVDNLPFKQSIFGMFASAIVEKLTVTLVATKLCSTILKDVKFSDIRHVITAITTPSAQGDTNYQRYEFFGDSILKFTVACQLYFEHPNWHEGYLTECKDDNVRNPRLTQVSLDVGLDAYIITKIFTPRKWSAPLISERTPRVTAAGKRELSSKVLADVVESLIGAAYMDGGMSAAQACIKQLMPQIDPRSLDTKTAVRHPDGNSHLMNERLPQHIGYIFKNKTLLKEALTHPSCDYDTHTQSYQRLEFLGDAVLDIIVITALSKHPIELPQGVMTMIKAAIVNKNLLSFFCMEFSMVYHTSDVKIGRYKMPTLIQKEQRHKLWYFMRYHGQELRKNRDAAVERHRIFYKEIKNSLRYSSSYPWELLAKMNAEKYFSDVIESILGAIFVDSDGDFALCEAFVERIGLMAYLRRVLDDEIDVIHPRARAQRMAKSDRLVFITEEQKFPSKSVEDSFPGPEDGAKLYSCAALLADVEVLVVRGCLSKEEAEVKAANAVVRYLRQKY